MIDPSGYARQGDRAFQYQRRFGGVHAASGEEQRDRQQPCGAVGHPPTQLRRMAMWSSASRSRLPSAAATGGQSGSATEQVAATARLSTAPAAIMVKCMRYLPANPVLHRYSIIVSSLWRGAGYRSAPQLVRRSAPAPVPGTERRN